MKGFIDIIAIDKPTGLVASLDVTAVCLLTFQ